MTIHESCFIEIEKANAKDISVGLFFTAHGRKSTIGHKKCNILLNERKVTNLEIFQHSFYCVHFKCIKVYIFVKVIIQGY